MTSIKNNSTDGIPNKDLRESRVPPVALCATSRHTDGNMLSLETTNNQSLLENSTTSMKGPLLGIVKPSWIKVAESEKRLAWLKTMWGKGLCVRNIEDYVPKVWLSFNKKGTLGKSIV